MGGRGGLCSSARAVIKGDNCLPISDANVHVLKLVLIYYQRELLFCLLSVFFCVRALFCGVALSVLSSFTIIMLRKRAH